MITPIGYPLLRDVVQVPGRVYAGPRKAIASTNNLNNRSSGSSLTLVQVEFTTQGSWTWDAPVGLSKLELLFGNGGFGDPGGEQVYIERYNLERTNWQWPAGDPTGYPVNSTFSGPYYGATPGNYCDNKVITGPNGQGYQYCYYYSDTSYWNETQPSQGPSANAFGFAFPGAYGGAQPPTTFADISNLNIVGGQQYSINVPFGGRIIFRYYI